MVLRQEQDGIFSEQKYRHIYDSMKLSWLFIIVISILFLIFFTGVYFYIEQLEKGLIVTGMGNRNFW
ncbi:MAG: hypothetical protein ACW99A_23515, partial [Candidatus Kariarchaeaceae archaeon]